MRNFIIAMWLWPLAWSSAEAQRIKWRVVGDTGGARSGCSGREAIAAIDGWFKSFNAADSAGLANALARPFAITTGSKWVRDDFPRRFNDVIARVVGYARERKRFHDERLTLDSVRFLGWKGTTLGFVPYFDRFATDLKARPIPGIGNGEYWCRRGIRTLHLAPDQSIRPPVQQAPAQPTLRITYLANAGVMLSDGKDRVLIDALFRKYKAHPVPDEQTQLQLALAQPPFDSISVILVTHYHGDHFAPEPIVSHRRFARYGPGMMSSQQVIDSLRAGMNLTGNNRFFGSARGPAPGTIEYTGVNGVTIYVMRLPHAGEQHHDVEQLGYIVQLGGHRVLHVGDADITEATFAPLRLHKSRIDVALIPYWALLNDESRRVIAQYIQPTRVIVTHVDARTAEGRRIADDVKAVFPGAWTFQRTMHTLTLTCHKDCQP
ncbi:MAG: MBL fold metallo-hydrolase [Gemmatimonadaceae bacterium]